MYVLDEYNKRKSAEDSLNICKSGRENRMIFRNNSQLISRIIDSNFLNYYPYYLN